MREILPDILTWSWFSEPQGYNFNGYLIRHGEGNLCIDPVKPAEKALEQIVREGIARILLTNRNHSRAANQVRGARAHRRARGHPSGGRRLRAGAGQ